MTPREVAATLTVIGELYLCNPSLMDGGGLLGSAEDMVEHGLAEHDGDQYRLTPLGIEVRDILETPHDPL